MKVMIGISLGAADAPSEFEATVGPLETAVTQESFEGFVAGFARNLIPAQT